MNDNSLNKYMRELEEYDLLEKDETLKLYEQAKNGDKTAREKLINSNLRLVVSIAKTFKPSGIDLLDLIQQGNIGLIKAVDSWDPKKGALSTFATKSITNSISRYCYENQNRIRKPEWQQELSSAIDKVITNYIQVSGRKPTVDEIAAVLDIVPEKIEKIYLDNSISYVPLDAPVSSENSTKIEETIPDEIPEFDQEKLKKAVKVALRYLEPEDAEFLESLYGINGKCKTLTQIGIERGLTKQTILNKKQELLQKLRYPEILEAIRKEL